MQMCWILGLTGGAGSGKSTAADIFRELGLPIIDADRISRAVTAAGGRCRARHTPSLRPRDD